MGIEELQDMYRLSERKHDEIYHNLKRNALKGSKPLRECNIIIGQKASGKTTLAKQIGSNGYVLFDKMIIDKQHPNYGELNELYPGEYPNIIAPDVLRWKNKLLIDVMNKGLNLNYETTGNNIRKLNDLITELKDNDYHINVFIISINYLESRLRLYENYIRCLERNRMEGFFPLGESFRNTFASIPDIVESLDFDNFDNVSFLDNQLVLYDSNINKDILVSEVRGLYNDNSNLNLEKRIEYIRNFIARYPELIKGLDISSLFAELDMLEMYYQTIVSENNGMTLKLTNSVKKGIE